MKLDYKKTFLIGFGFFASSLAWSIYNSFVPLMLEERFLASTAIIGFTGLAATIDMTQLPLQFAPWLVLLLTGYFAASQVVKGIYIKKHQEWF